jgi:hypothetical protein
MWRWAVQAGVLDSLTEDIKRGSQLDAVKWLPSLWRDLGIMCSLLCEYPSTPWPQEKMDEYLDAATAKIADGLVWLFPEVHCFVSRRGNGSIDDLKPEEVCK